MPARKRITPALPLSTLAIAYAIAFALLSTFAASRLTTAEGALRLVEPKNCAVWNLNHGPNNTGEVFYQRDLGKEILNAFNYADACYPIADKTVNKTNKINCDRYRTPAVPFGTSYATACNIGDLCISGNDSNPLVMDTGLLNSQEIFGVNAPPDSQVELRKLAVCSPINVTAYARNFDSNSTYLVRYYLGDAQGRNQTFSVEWPKYTIVSRDADSFHVQS